MPSLKNQHFVPRCLLKPFSNSGEGRFINLYNIRHDRLIPCAPLKGQCARNHLYGKDGRMEQALSKIESSFSRTRERIMAGSNADQDKHDLNFFTYLQFRRTEMAMRRLKESYELMNLEIFEDKNAHEIPSDHILVMESLKVCLDTRRDIEDMKIRIIENRTKKDLITSDDPAIYTNKFASQKLNGDGFGVASSGLLMFLPLAPKFAVVCYDGLVYTVPDLTEGRIVVKDIVAIEALNELQNLKAAENIYFSNWEDRDHVREQFLVVKDNRPKEWSTVKHLVLVRVDENGNEQYREGTLAEAKKAGKSVVQTSFKYPQPTRWFPAIKFGSKPKTFYNGTGVGHVRKAEWLSRRDR